MLVAVAASLVILWIFWKIFRAIPWWLWALIAIVLYFAATRN